VSSRSTGQWSDDDYDVLSERAVVDRIFNGLRLFATSGGLLFYGRDVKKYELTINLLTAKSLGLTVPDTLLARADEVIEQSQFAALHMSPIGTRLTKRMRQACPQLAEADIRLRDGNSRFDPKPS
jgi:hypothetical protein